jgi:hypothetical protein
MESARETLLFLTLLGVPVLVIDRKTAKSNWTLKETYASLIRSTFAVTMVTFAGLYFLLEC